MRHQPEIILEGLAFGESPRWHEGRLWLADWAAHELLALDPAAPRAPGEASATAEVVARVESFPFCLDALPDGRLLVLSSDDQAILRLEPDGTFVTHADLTGVSSFPWNEITVDGQGRSFINNIGFEFPGGEPASGCIGVVDTEGAYRQVADDVWFPNGMTVTSDGSTLIVAESYRSRLTAFEIGVAGGLTDRRVWADLGDHAPDGICLDAEGAVWYADVPNRCCVRVQEGGTVLDRIDLDRGCFSCALGGEHGSTLFVVATEWAGPSGMDGARTGQVVAVDVEVPAAARPGAR